MMHLMFIGTCESFEKYEALKTQVAEHVGFGYRYYEGGVSSVYFWDLDADGFAGVVLLKKCMTLTTGAFQAFADQYTNSC